MLKINAIVCDGKGCTSELVGPFESLDDAFEAVDNTYGDEEWLWDWTNDNDDPSEPEFTCPACREKARLASQAQADARARVFGPRGGRYMQVPDHLVDVVTKSILEAQNG